jgi:hypothetical protein
MCRCRFHERLVAFKAEGNIASSSTFEVPLSPLPEVPTAVSLAQAKSAKSSHNATMEREEPAPASATGQDDIETNNKAGATKARFPSNTKEGRAERYAAVLRRVKEREAKLAAAGSAEEQKEAFLFKSLPQLNLVLRSYVLSPHHSHVSRQAPSFRLSRLAFKMSRHLHFVVASTTGCSWSRSSSPSRSTKLWPNYVRPIAMPSACPWSGVLVPPAFSSVVSP